MRSIPSTVCCSSDASLPLRLFSHSSFITLCSASFSFPFSSVNITNDFVSELFLIGVAIAGDLTSITPISFFLLGDALIDCDVSAPIGFIDFIGVLAGDLAGDNLLDLTGSDDTLRVLSELFT